MAIASAASLRVAVRGKQTPKPSRQRLIISNPRKAAAVPTRKACSTAGSLAVGHTSYPAAHVWGERWCTATISTLLCLTAAAHSAEAASVLAACMGLVFAASATINDEQQEEQQEASTTSGYPLTNTPPPTPQPALGRVMFLQRSSNTVYAGYSPLPMEPPPVASATVHSAIKATVAGVRDGVRDGAVKPTRISLLPRLPRLPQLAPFGKRIEELYCATEVRQIGAQLVQVTVRRFLDRSGPNGPRIQTTIETTKRLGPAAAAGGPGVLSVTTSTPTMGSAGAGVGVAEEGWDDQGVGEDDGTWGQGGDQGGPQGGGPEDRPSWSSVGGGAFQAVYNKGRLGKNKSWMKTALVLSATATALLLVILAVLGIIGVLPGTGLEATLHAALVLSVVATIVLARMCSK